MRRKDAHEDPEIVIPVPQRQSLLGLTLLFSAALTLLVCVIAGRVLALNSPGHSLGIGTMLVIAAVTLALSCVAAILVFQRLQLPLEASRALNDEQAFRIDELESDADSAKLLPDSDARQQAEIARREAASLATQLGEVRLALARAEKKLEGQSAPAPPDFSAAGETPVADSLDPLTGLHSGSLRFERRMSELLESARRSGTFHGLLLIGIDRLGSVHDRYGPTAGEENIWQIAQQIREHVPNGGELFRVSAKHFAMLLPDHTDSASLELAQRLCGDIAAHEFAWQGRPLASSISIGVVSIGLADQSEAEIVDRAVHALGKAQQAGGGHAHREALSPTLERRAREKSLSDWLRDKIANQQLRLAAQPILPATANPDEPHWLELLLRIEDDDGVWLAPDHYVDVLERLQLTSMIDKWVLDTALAEGPQCRALRESGGRLSINIFGSSLMRDSFLVQLRDSLSRSALPTQQIVFELDEAFVVEHGSRVSAFVHEIAEFGCQLALDRYRGGVGLSALRQFPAQYIKLHESIVQRQTTDLIDRAHVGWLVSSAHLIGAKVVASAVRDEDTLKRAREAGIDYVQGFAIAPPGPY